MCALASSPGIPRNISRSKRPALRRAGSSESGRLVAPMTNTCPLPSTCPSSSKQDRSWVTILRSISLCAVSLLGDIASISSMKRTHGADSLACWKRSLRISSDSPDTPLTTSVAVSLMNGSPNSPAMAWASMVFPLPGGPWSKKP